MITHNYILKNHEDPIDDLASTLSGLPADNVRHHICELIKKIAESNACHESDTIISPIQFFVTDDEKIERAIELINLHCEYLNRDYESISDAFTQHYRGQHATADIEDKICEILGITRADLADTYEVCDDNGQLSDVWSLATIPEDASEHIIYWG